MFLHRHLNKNLKIYLWKRLIQLFAIFVFTFYLIPSRNVAQCKKKSEDKPFKILVKPFKSFKKLNKELNTNTLHVKLELIMSKIKIFFSIITLFIEEGEKCIIRKVSPSLLINKECAHHYRRETANENKQFKATRLLISNLYLIRDKGFKGTVLNWTLLSLHGGSLKLTLTVPLIHATYKSLFCPYFIFKIERGGSV